LADELRALAPADKLKVEVRPSKVFAAFEVDLQGERIYSKLEHGRLPQAGEVERIVMERLIKQ